MTFEPGTPLDPRQLSTAAQRALGPGPGRMMAARGMMPLPPFDQLTVLYQLAHDADAALAQFARTTAANLPDKLLSGTLTDQALDPHVLDYFGQLAGDKSAVFDAIVLNGSTHDTTIAVMASKSDARGVDLIAQNEQRLLRHPEIIAAMYMNRRARMSTIDRVVELAVRNHVRVPGLAAWDEVARALTGEPMPAVDDDLFDAIVGVPRDDSALTAGDAEQLLPDDDDVKVEAARSSKMLELHVTRPQQPTTRVPLRRTRVVVGSGETVDTKIAGTPAQWLLIQLTDAGATVGIVSTGERTQIVVNQTVMLGDIKLMLAPIPFRDLPIPAKIRAATLGDAFVRSEAIRDPIKLVSMAAIKSPAVTEIEATRYASNQSMPEDVIRYIATRKEWTKKYGVKFSLCRNPKTPVAETTRLLPFLRDKDLTSIIRSKGVPSAVVAQARKLQSNRGGKK